MKILHLCSYYIASKIYKNLIIELERTGLNNDVFIPIADKNLEGRNNFESNKTNLIYSKCLNKWDRLFFFNKQKKIYTSLKNEINILSIDVIHAHSLFTNGYTAYNLKKNYNKDYIVAVRNTDINVFFKYFFWLKKTGIEILKKSSKIILISPSYKAKLLNLMPDKLKTEIEKKIEIIPNGIEDFWFNNKPDFKKKNNQNLFFAGRLDRNKRILNVIKSVLYLNKNSNNVILNIAGDGPLKSKIEKLSKKHPGIYYLGKIDELYKLKDEYERAGLFIMPSKTETFGLVYIEAISQGCKIIYSKDQGVDGYKDIENFGESIQKADYKLLAFKIEKLLHKPFYEYNYMYNNFLPLFKWENIGQIYNKIYLIIN